MNEVQNLAKQACVIVISHRLAIVEYALVEDIRIVTYDAKMRIVVIAR